MKEKLLKLFNSTHLWEKQIIKIKSKISDDKIMARELLGEKFKYKDIIEHNWGKYVFTHFWSLRTYDKSIALELWNLKKDWSMWSIWKWNIYYYPFWENKKIINTWKKAK